jgi:hypothetical protein
MVANCDGGYLITALTVDETKKRIQQAALVLRHA